VGNVAGVFYTSDLGAGAPVVGFTASFKILISAGSANPADGFSLSFASDLPEPPAYGNPVRKELAPPIVASTTTAAAKPRHRCEVAGNIANGHVLIPKIQSATISMWSSGSTRTVR
jgi:hypothetical protein